MHPLKKRYMPKTNINDISTKARSVQDHKFNVAEIQKRFEKVEVRQNESLKRKEINWRELNAVVIKI